MPFPREKREFLVRVLGEARTKALEDGLPVITKALEDAGIGWKDLTDLSGSIRTGPASFQDIELRELSNQLMDIIGEIMTDVLLTLEEKADAIRKAASDFEQRAAAIIKDAATTGSKAMSPSESPAKKFVDLLRRPRRGAKSVDGKALIAIKELRTSGHPAADLVADLFEHGAVQDNRN